MPKLIISNQTNPYLNIAVENYLLSQPSDGDIIMYLWQNRRTVVIGQNQNPYSECNVAQLEADGGFLMRRRTGGGAVFHDLGNLNFSFVVPYEMYDTMRQFAVLQRAVAAYGLETEVSGRNDVLCQGRKFSGNAFSKGKHQRLHHGTILIRTDVEQLQRYLKVKPAKLQKHGVSSVQSRVVNLSELVPEITAQNIIPPLVQKYSKLMGVVPAGISYRANTSRWGSCNVKTKRLIFSAYLLLLPDWCIEHVVVHELAHLLIPNHGPKFHAVMDQYVPRWKEARATTRQITRNASPAK